MIEIEHHRVGLSAVRAGVLTEILHEALEIAVSVPRLDRGHAFAVDGHAPECRHPLTSRGLFHRVAWCTELGSLR